MKKSKLKRSLSIIGNTLFYLLLLVLLLFSITNLSIQSEQDIPNRFGKGFVTVLSGSMDGDEPDSFPKGALAFIDVLNEEAKNDIQIGEIIVFFDNSTKLHIIHRVVDIQGDSIITQGDVNARNYGRFDGTNF